MCLWRLLGPKQMRNIVNIAVIGLWGDHICKDLSQCSIMRTRMNQGNANVNRNDQEWQSQNCVLCYFFVWLGSFFCFHFAYWLQTDTFIVTNVLYGNSVIVTFPTTYKWVTIFIQANTVPSQALLFCTSMLEWTSPFIPLIYFLYYWTKRYDIRSCVQAHYYYYL